MTTLFNYNLEKKTGVIFYSDKKIVRKFSNYKESNSLISREFYGQRWYLKQLNKKKYFNKKFILKKKVNYIDNQLLLGKKLFYWKSIKKNLTQIIAIIDHYNYIWPQKKLVHFHGDLTIENAIFFKKKIFLIDWEHSRGNLPWGLDICYFLISAFVLPQMYFNYKKKNLSELNLFKSLWSNFFLNKKFEYLKNPFLFANKKKLFKKNHFIYKIPVTLKAKILNAIKT